MIENLIEQLFRLLFEIPAILLAIGIHEYFHGITARRFGDETAAEIGELNINPFPRIDLLGFIMFIWFRFGWTKEMPVDFRNIREPNARVKAVIVLLSGMVGNFLLAVFFILMLKLKKPAPESYLFNFIGYSIVLNFNMVIVNLLPFLPLDGGRIVALFNPRYERYTFVGAVAIIIFAFSNLSMFVQSITHSIFNLFI